MAKMAAKFINQKETMQNIVLKDKIIFKTRQRITVIERDIFHVCRFT